MRVGLSMRWMNLGVLCFAFAGCGDDGGTAADAGVVDASVDGAVDAAPDAASATLTEVVHAAAAGFSFSAMIDDTGALWTYGAGDVGVLGNGLLRGPGAFHLNAYAPIRPLNVDAFTMVDVGAGDNHMIALQSNGDVWSWGQNGKGQVGNDDQFTLALEPVQIILERPAVGVAAAGNHSLAVDSDGGLWSWGANATGQLGDGSTADAPAPVAVDLSALPTDITFTKVATGNSHSVALASDGTLWTWGAGVQLGLGTTTSSLTPAQVLGENGTGLLEGIVDIAAGKNHSLALASDGTLWAWGDGTLGQLGVMGLAGSATPAQLDTTVFSASVAKLRAGDDRSFVVLSDGALWAWGANNLNQLGFVGANAVIPTLIAVGAPVRDVATGREHGVAIDTSGAFWGWGLNQQGELGIGTTAPSTIPALGYGPSGLVPTGIMAADGEYSFIEMSDGTSWGVGINAPPFSPSTSGGIRGGASPTLVPAHVGINVQQVAGGLSHSLVLDSAGAVWGYGNNQFGQLGDGTTTSTFSIPIIPVATDLSMLPAGVTITKVAVGTNNSVALASDNTVWTWGRNGQGQLGNGAQATTAQSIPIQVLDAPGTGFLSNIDDISAGADHVVALDSNGIAWTWGLGTSGQLGASVVDVCTADACNLLPHEVCDIGSTAATCSGAGVVLGAVQAIATGGTHTLLLRGGQVLAFGARNVGQVGNGTQDDTVGIDVPVAVDDDTGATPLANITRIVAGQDTSFAVAMDGAVYGWGNNAEGQQAKDPTTTTTGCAVDTQCLLRPGAIPELAALTLVDLQAGVSHVLAIDDTGVVWSWGDNNNGQLGHLFDAMSPLGKRISIVPAAATYLPQ
jgi:alpha-tubulin suppressor-like RCC1 family protein